MAGRTLKKIKVIRADIVGSDSVTRGFRAQTIRQSLGYSRRKFSETHNIPCGSVQNWEDARHGGLGEQGASRLIKAFKAEGITTTVEYLMFGIGDCPTPLVYVKDKEQIKEGTPEYAFVKATPPNTTAEELALFHTLNPNTLDTTIPDNSMEPHLRAGDVVAGICYFPPDIDDVIGHHCIVQMKNSTLQVCHLKAGTEPNHYRLLHIGTNTDIATEVELLSAAPILWIRRKI